VRLDEVSFNPGLGSIILIAPCVNSRIRFKLRYGLAGAVEWREYRIPSDRQIGTPVLNDSAKRRAN
jgi:hypothetical protein